MYENLGCCGNDDDENLGFALPAIGGAISAVSSLFGGGKDTSGTKVFINGLLTRALNGDVKADHQIRCLAGDSSYKAEFGGTCGYAHSEDRAVAQSAVDALDAKGPSSNYAASSLVPLGGPIVAGMSLSPLLIAGAAAAGIYFLSKRR